MKLLKRKDKLSQENKTLRKERDEAFRLVEEGNNFLKEIQKELDDLVVQK